MAQAESQGPPPEEPITPANGVDRPRRRRLLLIGGGVLVGVALVAAAVVFLLLQELGQPRETAVKFLPASTRVYFTINLRPGNGQITRLRETLSIFEDTPDFLEWRDEWLNRLEEETGIDFMNDVLPWLGGEITFALLDAMAEPTPEWVVFVKTKDRDASEDFLGALVGYLEDEAYMGFDDDTYQGALLYTEEDDAISFALTDDFLLVGSSASVVKDTILDLESPPSRPLSEDEEFLQVRRQLPSERFMLAFARTEDLYRDAERSMDLYDFEALAPLEGNIPGFVALSGSFVDKGIRLDLLADTSPGSMVTEANRLNTAEALPEDTLFMMSVTGLQEAWETLRDSLRDIDEYAAGEFDDALAELEDETGINLERDIIDALIGEVTLALLPSDFRLDEYGNPRGAIEALLLAETGDRRGLERTLNKLTALLEVGLGLPVSYEDVGDYEAVVLDVRDLGSEWQGFSPGYLFTEDMVALGTTVDALLEMADTLDGSGRSLRSAPRFSRLVDMAPRDAAFVMFADLAGIIQMVVDALPPALRSDYDRDVRPYLEPLDAFFAASAVSEETTQLTLVLTVRE